MIPGREAAVLIIYLSLSVVSCAGVFEAFSVWLNDKGFTSSEYCTDRWISTNYRDLKLTLEAKLYGQHLVIEPLVNHIKAHEKDNPRKALVLSLHGRPGTGKNYASQIVAENMFVKGMKSKYVHLISAIIEFPHESKTDYYKDKVKDIIETSVKECPRSLFIFDEIDNMPPGIIDTLKPYLDFHDNLGGVDYRKATFFFLSNTAAKDITEKALTTWKNGLERESIELMEMEEIIRLPALNEKSGLWHSELIVTDLITAYIPFLPLERGHIKQCIRDGLIQKGYYKLEKEISEVKVQEIADELRYYPEGLGLFSTTGCKRVYDKIDFIMVEEQLK